MIQTSLSYNQNNTLLTTQSNTSSIITLDYTPSLTIESLGYWDVFNLSGYTMTAIINNTSGASFNGEGGSLTVNGPGNYYASGLYTTLNASLYRTSRIDAQILGNSTITSTNNNILNLTGDNGQLTIIGSFQGSVVGHYDILDIETIGYDTTLSVSSMNSTLHNVNGTLGLTVSNSGTAFLTTETGSKNTITGQNMATLNLNNSGGNTIINGSWGMINTTSYAYSTPVNIASQNANIINDGGQVLLTGTGMGTLTYTDHGSQFSNILVGEWATSGGSLTQNDTMNISSTYGNWNLSHGAHATVYQPLGGQMEFTLTGGDLTLTTNQTARDNLNFDAGAGGHITINNVNQNLSNIILNNTNSASNPPTLTDTSDHKGTIINYTTQGVTTTITLNGYVRSNALHAMNLIPVQGQ